LENLYKLEGGILSSEVRFLEKKLLLSFDLSKISLSKIARLIADLGYAPDISLQDLEEKRTPSRDRSFYYKLGIAGFCTGNIMLMSFPEYLGLELESMGFQTFFSWINLGLALPVLFYSASIFFASAWKGIKQGHLNIDVPVSIGILALFFQSTYEILSKTGPGYLDSMAGLVFFLLAGRWFQQKSYDQLSFEGDFKSYFPIGAKVLKDGKEKSVLLSNLKKGDVLFVRNEEIIPADARLMDPQAYLDYSFVTGESDPVSKNENEKLFAGGKIVGKGVRVQLLKTVSESYLIQLWKNHGPLKQKTQGIQFLADRLSKNFTFAILTVALLAGSYWFVQADLPTAVQISIAVLIVACPCGLALSSPIVLGNAMRFLGKNGFFLKNSQVLEQLEGIDELVFDKTGTLTLAQRDDSFAPLRKLPEEQKALVVALAKESGHPVSRQIQQELGQVTPAVLQSSQEIPGQGIRGRAGDHLVQIGNEHLFEQTISKDLTQGATGISIDGLLLTEIIRRESPRKGLKEVLVELQKSFRLSLLTGDSKMRAESLRQYFPAGAKFLWKQLPEEKLQHIKSLQQAGRKVMMIGDGLNDAGALMQANVGIVMAEKLESFAPACEVILDAESFRRLPDLLRYAKRSLWLLRIALVISLLYNLLGLGFAVQGLLSPLVAAILMPLSSLSVIFWGLGSTSLLAKSMGLILKAKE
jgi:Cu+-exporting ATPase